MGYDKKLHFMAGFIITMFIALINPALGLLMGVIAGAGKEIIWDWKMGRGKPELLDFIATCIGSTVCYGLVRIVLVI